MSAEETRIFFASSVVYVLIRVHITDMEVRRMRLSTTFLIICLASAVSLAQTHTTPNTDKAREEIQKLFTDLNEAITKKDRPTLERLYADDFQFVRPSGVVITKTAQ